MKQSKAFNYCEFCNKAIESPPPTSEQYEQGIISLGQFSSMLLPDKIAGQNSHSIDLEGYYCNYQCLYLYLKKILRINEK